MSFWLVSSVGGRIHCVTGGRIARDKPKERLHLADYFNLGNSYVPEASFSSRLNTLFYVRVLPLPLVEILVGHTSTNISPVCEYLFFPYKLAPEENKVPTTTT